MLEAAKKKKLWFVPSVTKRITHIYIYNYIRILVAMLPDSSPLLALRDGSAKKKALIRFEILKCIKCPVRHKKNYPYILNHLYGYTEDFFFGNKWHRCYRPQNILDNLIFLFFLFFKKQKQTQRLFLDTVPLHIIFNINVIEGDRDCVKSQNLRIL